MSKIKLKPCPFCGGETEIHSPKISIYPNGIKDRKEYVVRCKNTKCFGRVTKKFSSKDKAIEAWNIRKPMERNVEQLMNKYRKVNCDEDLEWNRAISKAIEIAEGGAE